MSETTHSADLDLVRAALGGDPEAQGLFAERMLCIRRILLFKNGRLRLPFSREEIDDLRQETFALLWQKLSNYQGHGPLEAYAYRFCCNILMNAQQRRSRQRARQEATEEANLVDPGSARGDPLARELLFAALSRLGDDLATLIERKVLDEQTFEEISKDLAISVNTAKSRYYRAIRFLQETLPRSFRSEGP